MEEKILDIINNRRITSYEMVERIAKLFDSEREFRADVRAVVSTMNHFEVDIEYAIKTAINLQKQLKERANKND
jgi:plasmid maintenance system antidote protein VapI